MISADHKYDRFIGVDVAKNSLMIYDSNGGSPFQIDNTTGAIKSFLTSLQQAHCLIICEATGGYEMTLLKQVLEAQMTIHRADARKVKSYIRSFGRLGKTDAIDARALADYGRERAGLLQPWQEPDAKRVHLQELVARRDDLIAMRVAETNRSKAPGSGYLAHSFTHILNTLKKAIVDIERAIKALIASSQSLSKSVEVLKSIPGIATTTASNLIALMPELGLLTRRKAAALAGLAPHPADSGNSNGYRSIRGGRPQVRRAVYMAALTASRSNGPLGEFVKRLKKNGKKPIVAITALMRKIITIANARIRDQIYIKQQS